jgi:hypothetical protein
MKWFRQHFLPFILIWVVGVQQGSGQTEVLLLDSFAQPEIGVKTELVRSLKLVPEIPADFQVLVNGASGPPVLTIETHPAIRATVFLQLLYTITDRKKNPQGDFYDALLPVVPGGRINPPVDRLETDRLLYWIDLVTQKDIAPGNYTIKIKTENSESVELSVEVLPRVSSAAPAYRIDYNEYGDKYLAAWPDAVNRDEKFTAERSVYRLVRDHGGVLNVLPYKSQSGKPRKGLAPAVGINSETIDFDGFAEYNSRFGPLFNGKAFENGIPLEHAYLPFNPAYPAGFDLYLKDRSRYEAIWLQMAQKYLENARANNWTATVFQVYMNQKPDEDNGIPWNLDEPKGRDDYLALKYFRDLSARSFIGFPEIQVKFRVDISHFYCDEHRFSMDKDFRVNGGYDILQDVDIWAISDHSLSGKTARKYAGDLIRAGKEVWHYGATPEIGADPADTFRLVTEDWRAGFTGLMIWKSLNRKLDYRKGSDFIYYSGKSFGVQGIIPSKRMKFLRDAWFDLRFLQFLGENEKVPVSLLKSREQMRGYLLEKVVGN